MTGRATSYPLLHVDLVLLREDVPAADREALSSEAASLARLPGVIAVSQIEGSEGSDFDEGFVFLIDSPANLEGFGTDPRYVRFLQAGLARAMRSFGGSDARLLREFPAPTRYGACLGLAAGPQTYDWQVSEALGRWVGTSGTSGLAIGERQRYRGVGLMFSEQPIPRPQSGFEGFGVEFVSGSLRTLS